MNSHIQKVLIAFDQFCNAFAPASIDGITISAHAGMAAKDGRKWGIAMRWFLNKFEANHCENAIINDCKRAEAVLKELGPYRETINQGSSQVSV